MQQADLVCVGERVANLIHVLNDLLEWQQPVGRRVLLERAAGDEFHHQVAELLGRTGLEQLDDVRMAQLAGEPRFVHPHLLHAIADFRVLEQLEVGQLDRHLALQERIVSKVHRPHASRAEFPPDLEARAEKVLGTSERISLSFSSSVPERISMSRMEA